MVTVKYPSGLRKTRAISPSEQVYSPLRGGEGIREKQKPKQITHNLFLV